jgi:hypothetical protein
MPVLTCPCSDLVGVQPKAFPLADAALTNQILDLVQQASHYKQVRARAWSILDCFAVEDARLCVCLERGGAYIRPALLTVARVVLDW